MIWASGSNGFKTPEHIMRRDNSIKDAKET